jgi:hypothetical protein
MICSDEFWSGCRASPEGGSVLTPGPNSAIVERPRRAAGFHDMKKLSSNGDDRAANIA